MVIIRRLQQGLRRQYRWLYGRCGTATERQWQLRGSMCNGEDRSVATAIDPRWRRWSHGGENGAAAVIPKRSISGGGDNLAARTGIEEVVVVIVRLSDGV